MKMYGIARFTVIGQLVSFPVDMLRYDACYPADQESVTQIADSLDPQVRSEHRAAGKFFKVRISMPVARKELGPTSARWSSFGWQIEPGSLRIDKL